MSIRPRFRALQLAGSLFLVGALTAFAAALAAQAIPDIFARHRGKGTLEMRGANDVRQLSEATVDVRPNGAVSIRVVGPKINLEMTGRTNGWTTRNQIDVVLERYDGQPTNVKGWLRPDDRGGFEQLELDGQTPGRIGVSFRSNGKNLESGRPKPPVPPVVTPPPGSIDVTVEPGTIRRGLDYRTFRTGFVRDCSAACRNDTQCRAYTYLEQETQCLLLATATAPEARRGSTSGVKRTAGSGGASGAFDVRLGFDQPGNDFSSVRTGNAEECLASCEVNSRCRAFTYVQESGVCYLKERSSSLRQASGKTTGTRRQ